MKLNTTLSVILALSISSLAIAQSDNMKGMGMKDMDTKDCMAMKGMDMKDMDAKKCKKMMKGMDTKHPAKDAKAMTYQAVAIVKQVDPAGGKVVLAHEPIKSLKWPAMTMGFAVKDKMLFDKLVVGKKVQVEFVKQDADYVVTAVK